MAWIFLPGSMMMPALAPMEKADTDLTLGYRDLQVRGRLVSHLEDFTTNFMDPFDLDHSEIQETPWADYTCRFYTTREAYGAALANAMLDIDYASFKIQAERMNPDGTLRYAKGKEYHEVLTSVWSASAQLNPPGGYYGPRSPQNPRGYDVTDDELEEPLWP